LESNKGTSTRDKVLASVFIVVWLGCIFWFNFLSEAGSSKPKESSPWKAEADEF
jgi:hypothetical protein